MFEQIGGVFFSDFVSSEKTSPSLTSQLYSTNQQLVSLDTLYNHIIIEIDNVNVSLNKSTSYIQMIGLNCAHLVPFVQKYTCRINIFYVIFNDLLFLNCFPKNNSTLILFKIFNTFIYSSGDIHLCKWGTFVNF